MNAKGMKIVVYGDDDTAYEAARLLRIDGHNVRVVSAARFVAGRDEENIDQALLMEPNEKISAAYKAKGVACDVQARGVDGKRTRSRGAARDPDQDTGQARKSDSAE